MAYQELSLSGFVSEMKDASSGPHPRKFCIVLGAGASRSSGIKTGKELVDHWEGELKKRNAVDYEAWKFTLGITPENKYSFYSSFYDKLYRRNHRDGYNFLEKQMENKKPSVGYVMLAHLLNHTGHNVVITTNFDHLMEDAVNYYEQCMPLVIGHEALTHYLIKPLTRPTILKIHRDLLFEPANRPHDVDKLHTSWHTALGTVFSEYHPVFIGYAGNDNSLMDYLLENSARFADGSYCYPYWMLYSGDTLDGKVLKYLEQSDGYCIRHDGFDDVITLLAYAFNYKIPDEEDFLSDPKKRYRDLAEAIDKSSVKVSKSTGDFYVSSTGERLEESSRSPSDYPEGQASADILKAMESITSQTEAQRLYRSSVSLHNAGNFEAALAESQKLVALQPDNARYHDSLGVTLHAMNRYDEALPEKQKAVELEPDNALYRNSLGVTLHEMKRYDEALTEKQKTVGLAPDNALYRNSLGVTLHAMKRYEEALAEKQKAVELEPDNARYHNSLSDTLHAMKRYEEALAEKQ